MKIKPNDKAGGVVVELGAQEERLPSGGSPKETTALPVFQLKKILVPVDFSKCSKKALQYAVPFAKQFNAELTLLYIEQLYPEFPEAVMAPVETAAELQQDLEALRATIGNAVPSRALVKVGDPNFGIIDAAKELDIDLIILATHGRKGLERALLGSTAEKVVRYAGCPVLIVREHEHEFIASREPEATEIAI
jgi:universal stress protein A